MIQMHLVQKHHESSTKKSYILCHDMSSRGKPTKNWDTLSWPWPYSNRFMSIASSNMFCQTIKNQLVGAQPPPCYSFARHWVGKMEIHPAHECPSLSTTQTTWRVDFSVCPLPHRNHWAARAGTAVAVRVAYCTACCIATGMVSRVSPQISFLLRRFVSFFHSVFFGGVLRFSHLAPYTFI